MRAFPFAPHAEQIEVPRDLDWFPRRRVTVYLEGDLARIEGDETYRLVARGDSFDAALRWSGGYQRAGIITPHTLRGTVADRHTHRLGLVRSAIYDVPFPSPLAYRMADGSMVHPGPCYDRHPLIATRRSYFILKDDKVRCDICKEPFL